MIKTAIIRLPRISGISAVWSARLIWVQEVVGSNPASPTVCVADFGNALDCEKTITKQSKMFSINQKGLLTELQCQLEFSKAGIVVFAPITLDSKADLNMYRMKKNKLILIKIYDIIYI